jgi:hypothetical protein
MAIEPVMLGVGGFAYIAPVGTTAPTTPFDDWPTGWVDLADVDENGLTESLGEDRTQVMKWGSNRPARSQVKSRVSTYKITLINITANALALYYSVPVADMTSSGSGPTQFLSFSDPDTTAPYEMALGLDVLDGDRHLRFVTARAEVTAKGDLVYKGDVPVGFDLTFTALEAPGGATSIQRMYGGVALPA